MNMCKGLCLLLVGALLLLFSLFLFISLIKAVGVFLIALIGAFIAIEGADLLRTELFIRRLDKRVRV